MNGGEKKTEDEEEEEEERLEGASVLTERGQTVKKTHLTDKLRIVGFGGGRLIIYHFNCILM